jgi:glycosyltransferase involved in cell wall biosynthesis
MHLLVDYRPALRARTGVGEWIHNLVRSVLHLPARSGGTPPPSVTLFVSSWKDRPSADARRDLGGAAFADRRIPVRLLTLAWNRLSWPPVESLIGGRYDVALSATPLLVPSRASVKVVTVHDFDFLDHPERTWGEMRRDFPVMVSRHVRAADLVATNSRFTALEAERRLGIPPERLVVCRPGIPDWIAALDGWRDSRPAPGGYILFVGTLEGRKNVPGLLAAYAKLVAKRPAAPNLVLAGAAAPGASDWLQRALVGPLANRVEVRGYVAPGERPALYAGAAMLVLPSYMEGFGLPVLEAMALGLPVLVSSRGALPEVAGDAGVILDPDDADGWADAMARVVAEPGLSASMSAKGRAQAARFSWQDTAAALVDRLGARLAPAAPSASSPPDHFDAHRH